MGKEGAHPQSRPKDPEFCGSLSTPQGGPWTTLLGSLYKHPGLPLEPACLLMCGHLGTRDIHCHPSVPR